MSRQHTAPLFIAPTGEATALAPLALALALGQDGHGWSEAAVQALIHAHPACLPIAEIDPVFAQPVPICTELNTSAGALDNLLVTASGLPVLVECKLWRNPQARREVVGQILDYAKELSRWSSADLQREVRRRLGREGDPVLELVRAAGHAVDEIAFGDALTLNLRRGRFLLLIVGDGIREGVEAIAEYLQAHAGLHFTLGLVELPIYATPDGGRLVAPRVVARTTLIRREVVAVPDGHIIREPAEPVAGGDEQASDGQDAYRLFMQEVVDGLVLTDPEQPVPRLTPGGWLFLYLPAPQSTCWISILDRRSPARVGVRFTSTARTIGEAAVRRLVSDWPAVRDALGGTAELHDMGGGRYRVHEFLQVDREAGPSERERAIDWLRRRIDDYVSVFRPRVRDAVEQLKEN